MGVAEEHRYNLATEIRQPALLTVEVGELEVLTEVRPGDVGGAERRCLRPLVAPI